MYGHDFVIRHALVQWFSYCLNHVLSGCRLMFLSTLMDVFNDRMMLFSASTQTAFCTACVRWVKKVIQGYFMLCEIKPVNGARKEATV